GPFLRKNTPDPLSWPDPSSELFQDIVRRLHNLCTVPQKAMCAAVAAGEHVAGHGQHIASLLERTARRNERPALVARLDDDHRPGEAADDTIALREEVLLRRRSRHQLAQDGAVVL